MKTTHHQPVLLTLAILVLAGCADDPTQPEIEVTGHYRSGFETSELILCESGETWWVSQLDDLGADYDAIAGDSGEGIYLSAAGVVTEYGYWGHMGQYSRAIRITSVHEARAWSEGDCGESR